MANLMRNIFKYSRDYLKSSYRLVHNEANNNNKAEALGQKDDEDLPITFEENPYTKEKKVCILCRLNIDPDYKNVRLLSQFQSSYTGRIYGRHITGLCKAKQEKVETEIIKAQNCGFMPLRRDDIKVVEPASDKGGPLIVNFFDESRGIKQNQAPRAHVPFNQEDLIRKLKQDVENSRAELNENKRTLEHLLIEIKSTLQDIKRREIIQTNAAVASSPPLSDLQVHQLKMMVAKNEREERQKRQLNILVVGMKIFDVQDVMYKASEFLEKYFDLRDCVVSARTLGRYKDILVIQLKDAEVKANIQRNHVALKDTGIQIRPDLTVEQRFIYRKLRQIGLEAMKLGKVVKIGYTWVEIDHVKYYWNYNMNCLQPTSTKLEKYWHS